MRPRALKNEDKDVLNDSIDEQPVGADVALAIALHVAVKGMVAAPLRKGGADEKQGHDGIQLGEVAPLPHGPLQILSILA